MSDTISSNVLSASFDDDELDSMVETISEESWIIDPLPALARVDQMLEKLEKIVQPSSISPTPSTFSVDSADSFDWCDVKQYTGDATFGEAHNSNIVENVRNKMDHLFHSLDERVSFSHESDEVEVASADLPPISMERFWTMKSNPKQILKKAAESFPKSPKIVECIATEYMNISKSMANGDLAEQLMKVFINPLEMKMVGWTRAKIHHALTHALGISKRVNDKELTKPEYREYNYLVLELCRGFAACFLSDDIKRNLVELRLQMIQVKKGVVNSARFARTNGNVRVLRPHNDLYYPDKKNKQIKSSPLCFKNEKQYEASLSHIRKVLGDRRKIFDTLTNYRIYNKAEVQRLFEIWTKSRYSMSLPSRIIQVYDF